jgi:hypothetical protein
MPIFVYSAMEIGCFLQNFIKMDGNLHNKIKFKLMKFKSRNTTNYTLKQDSRVKSFEYNIQYRAKF